MINKYKKLFNLELAKAKYYLANPERLRKDINDDIGAQSVSYILKSPSPDQFSYRMIRYKGFVKYRKRLMNYVIALNEPKAALRSYLPVILDIEPTSRCNFRCIMCQLTDWKSGRRAADLSFKEFKQIIDSQPGLTEVKLQGTGEPLLNKDFFKMVNYLTKRHIWIRTTLNGSLLHLNNNYKKLVDNGVNEIQISFDGADKTTFEKIRRNSNFNQIVRNLKALNHYANSRGIIATRMWVLLQKHNKHQIFDFIKLAKHMEFKRVTFSIGLSDFGQNKWNKSNKLLQIKSFLSRRSLEKLLKLAKQYGIEITYWNLAKKYSHKNKKSLCQWPFSRAFVSSDAKLVPCCMIGNPEVANLGKADKFIEIWNSNVYQRFRRAHLSGNLPRICLNCYKK